MNHAMNRDVLKLSNEQILYSIDLINLAILNKKFQFDKKLFLKRRDELKIVYKLRIK